jgi:hypothetical protein
MVHNVVHHGIVITRRALNIFVGAVLVNVVNSVAAVVMMFYVGVRELM